MRCPLGRSVLKVTLLCSGSATTASAVVSAIRDGSLRNVQVSSIIFSRETEGIQRVREAGLDPEKVHIIKSSGDPDELADSLLKIIEPDETGIIFQCGWRKRTPVKFIKAYKGRILNQHPAALDSGRRGFGGKGMYGRAPHHAVLLYIKYTGLKDFWTEATVHDVIEEYDAGLVRSISPVLVTPVHTVESLQAEVLEHEHELVVATIDYYSKYGLLPEVKRPQPLIPEHYVWAYELAMQEARATYPKG